MEDLRPRNIVDAVRQRGPRRVFVNVDGRIHTMPATVREVGTYDERATKQEILEDIQHAEIEAELGEP